MSFNLFGHWTWTNYRGHTTELVTPFYSHHLKTHKRRNFNVVAISIATFADTLRSNDGWCTFISGVI